MAYTDKLLSFEFIERKLNVDTKRLRAFRVNRDGTREAWLSDVVREFTPSTRPTGRQAGSVAGWWAGCENRSRWILGTACQCEPLGLALVPLVSVGNKQRHGATPKQASGQRLAGLPPGDARRHCGAALA